MSDLTAIIDEHQLEYHDAGDGYHEPRESWVSCSCNELYYQWQQHAGCDSDCSCFEGGDPAEVADKHMRHIAQVFEEAATITSIEQLDALPFRSIVTELDEPELGCAWQKSALEDNGIEWLEFGAMKGWPTSEITLPVRVLWTPGGGE